MSGPRHQFRLASSFDLHVLRRLAGPASFARGRDYFDSGKVRSLTEEANAAVVARVRGAKPYEVKVWADGKDLAYSCSCPRGDDGEFCKHCVAAGLAILAGTLKPPKVRPPRPRVTRDDVREYLARADKSVLVELLMNRAEWDDTLRDQLFLRAAKSRKTRGVDVEAMKEVIADAIDPGDFLAWNEVGDYANGVGDAIDTIAKVLEEGHATEALELTEFALEAAETAIGLIDDSDGHMGNVLERLQDLHHTACRKARPDPAHLARRLFERELASGYDVFRGAVTKYADVLGKEGIDEYRRLAGERWSGVPAVGPGEKDPERHGFRFRISAIMTALARMDADVEAQVKVLKKDLSSAHAFLKIAETYGGARNSDLALEWAEKGLKAFPDRPDPRLRAFVTHEYHHRQRHDDAMALVWANFSRRPRLEDYQELKAHADRTRTWPAWRERAWERLRGDVAERQRRDTGQPALATRADHSTLVEVLLWEGDLDAAWEEARSGGCSETLWLALAKVRVEKCPLDALPIYQRQVDLTLRQADKDAYADAVKLLKKVRHAMDRAGVIGRFVEYLESVRAVHARKRNFVRLLDRAKWG